MVIPTINIDNLSQKQSGCFTSRNNYPGLLNTMNKRECNFLTNTET